MLRAIPNPLLDTFEAALKDFISAPTCPVNVPTAISKRYSEEEDGYLASRHASYGDIAIRATPTTSEVSTVLTALTGLISSVRHGETNPWVEQIKTIWTSGVKATLPYFAMATLSVFLKTWIGSNLVLFQASDVALIGDNYDDEGDFTKRSLQSPEEYLIARGVSSDLISSYPADEHIFLQGRASAAPKKFIVTLADGTTREISWPQPTWRSSGSWPANSLIYTYVLILEDPTDCSNSNLMIVPYTRVPTGVQISTEHIVEGNTPQNFFSDRHHGLLRSRQASRFAPQISAFWTDWLNSSWMTNTVALSGSLNPRVPVHRLMESLGSRRNTENFLILLQVINQMKSTIWQRGNKEEDIADLVADLTQPTVWPYYSDPVVHRNMVRGANAFRGVLAGIQNGYNAINLGRDIIDPVGPWDEWIRDHFRSMAIRSLEFINTNIAAMRTAHQPGGPTNPITLQVFEHLVRLARDARYIDANTLIIGLN
ncbi:hypothetical protein V499_00896 [Pseudogymnoascus sp. VKM F-103]|nr:hypothetical protein V499_00896 [Pseudogymnoascus sp. VKM F-103]